MLKWTSSCYKIENQLDISFKGDVNQKLSNGGKQRPAFKEEEHECLMETFCTCTKDAQPEARAAIRPFVRRQNFTITKINKKSARISSVNIPLLNQHQQCDEDGSINSAQCHDQKQLTTSPGEETKESNATIPRTGFDFLDNW